MEFKDYYKIMGLAPHASPEEIKRAYRKLARKYHPDVSKESDAETKFKEVGEAYEVLKDKKKRAEYDMLRQYQGQQHNPHQANQGAHGSRPFSEEKFAFEGGNFEDILSQFFGNRGAPFSSASQAPQAADIHAKLNISLEESFHGAEKTIQLQSPHHSEANGKMTPGLIKVKIPKGITDKQQIRLKGQGHDNGRGQRGDLYIEIHLLPHPLFQVEKKNIYLQLPIAPWEAALGASVQVPTLGGPLKVKIPKLSQSGRQLRLKAKGLPGSPSGDQILTLQIVIPPKEETALTSLYEKMAEESHFNPREKLGV